MQLARQDGEFIGFRGGGNLPPTCEHLPYPRDQRLAVVVSQRGGQPRCQCCCEPLDAVQVGKPAGHACGQAVLICPSSHPAHACRHGAAAGSASAEGAEYGSVCDQARTQQVTRALARSLPDSMRWLYRESAFKRRRRSAGPTLCVKRLIKIGVFRRVAVRRGCGRNAETSMLSGHVCLRHDYIIPHMELLGTGRRPYAADGESE